MKVHNIRLTTRNTMPLLLTLVFLSSGCVVRTYTATKDRVDQDLTMGNRGYLQGQAPAGEEKERKAKRTIGIVEVEIKSPREIEKAPKTRPQEAAFKQETEDVSFEGNRGYITKSITPEVIGLEVTPGLSFKEYTVQKGDTLQKISMKFYGTTKRWNKIYKANKDILKGPNKIYPGQVINIPIEKLEEPEENLK